MSAGLEQGMEAELARDWSVAVLGWPRRRCLVVEDGVATRVQGSVDVEGTCKV
jgi:hypothetical protein